MVIYGLCTLFVLSGCIQLSLASDLDESALVDKIEQKCIEKVYALIGEEQVVHTNEIKLLKEENTELKSRLSELGQEIFNISTWGLNQVPEKSGARRWQRTVMGLGRVEPRILTTRAADGAIAFQVQLSGDTCVNTNEIIKFDQIFVNIGGGAYTPSDGIYTVPTTGTYVFTWTVVADSRSFIVVDFVVDGTVRGTTMSDSEHADDFHPATGTAVVSVQAGNHVFLRMQRGGCHLKSDPTRARTAFSGWSLE